MGYIITIIYHNHCLIVPFPRDLIVDKKMSRSVLVSWTGPDDSLTPVSQYHVCIDGVVRSVVPGSYKCRSLIEDLPLDRFVNLSVRYVNTSLHYIIYDTCHRTISYILLQISYR
jgi:hypothetical protein